MKYITLSNPLFANDIIEYINKREVMCQIVISACAKQMKKQNQAITYQSRLFNELELSIAEIITVIIEAGRRTVMIKFPLTLIFQLYENITVEDLAGLLCKYMRRVIRDN